MLNQGWTDGAERQSSKGSADESWSGRDRNNRLHRVESRTRKKRKRSRIREEADGHGIDAWHKGQGRQGSSVQRSRRDTGERFQNRSRKRNGKENPYRGNQVKAKQLTIALAGNANVGKSVIFNHLTGLHQHIGNWPGKTVEKAEGTVHFKGYMIDIIDLPGIYSLSTFSLEELISREYIAFERPDIVINVVDASVLERNLFFTLQLMELDTLMILALNQMDIAAKKGIEIDYQKLAEILGVPVVPTVAIGGMGVYDLLEKAVEVIERGRPKPGRIEYGREIEEHVHKLANIMEEAEFKYPARWTAIKLLKQMKRSRRKSKT